MLYHREALLPIDVELMPDRRSDDVEPIDDYIQAMLQVRDDLKPEAMRSTTDRWLGLYTINRNLRKGVYELKRSSGKLLKKKYNIARLKVICLITH